MSAENVPIQQRHWFIYEELSTLFCTCLQIMWSDVFIKGILFSHTVYVVVCLSDSCVEWLNKNTHGNNLIVWTGSWEKNTDYIHVASRKGTFSLQPLLFTHTIYGSRGSLTELYIWHYFVCALEGSVKTKMLRDFCHGTAHTYFMTFVWIAASVEKNIVLKDF